MSAFRCYICETPAVLRSHPLYTSFGLIALLLTLNWSHDTTAPSNNLLGCYLRHTAVIHELPYFCFSGDMDASDHRLGMHPKESFQTDQLTARIRDQYA